MVHGIIYKIVTPESEQCYIGSTKNRLCLRKALHMYQFRQHLKNGDQTGKTTAFQLLKMGNCEFIPIEEGNFETISDLRKREREIQAAYKSENKLINLNEAYQTIEERKIKNRLRAKQNYAKCFLTQQSKSLASYYANLEKRRQHSREYYHTHRDELLAKVKQNKEHSKKCECGITYSCSTEKHLANRCHQKRMDALALSINNDNT